MCKYMIQIDILMLKTYQNVMQKKNDTGGATNLGHVQLDYRREIFPSHFFY